MALAVQKYIDPHAECPPGHFQGPYLETDAFWGKVPIVNPMEQSLSNRLALLRSSYDEFWSGPKNIDPVVECPPADFDKVSGSISRHRRAGRKRFLHQMKAQRLYFLKPLTVCNYVLSYANGKGFRGPWSMQLVDEERREPGS